MKIQSYKELHVWQHAIALADIVYDITQTFPNEERFGLSNQLRRAVVSIASNIAEGSVRGSRKEFAHFITIARGSLAEVETQLVIAHNRKYILIDDYEKTASSMTSLSKMLMRLLQSLKTPTE